MLATVERRDCEMVPQTSIGGSRPSFQELNKGSTPSRFFGTHTLSLHIIDKLRPRVGRIIWVPGTTCRTLRRCNTRDDPVGFQGSTPLAAASQPQLRREPCSSRGSCCAHVLARGSFAPTTQAVLWWFPESGHGWKSGSPGLLAALTKQLTVTPPRTPSAQCGNVEISKSHHGAYWLF
ncbi:uncharacterized protein M421DRAFT_385391 [Didymella exigua CBS 183.55]|uniref:Uncharacterized protein n=1 Tax=Didymella exigua CBS 183.55 TaxID=1150837 RepID=A0A6A5RR71_9PLEO|nr:uncharacterized protein M421DRAFT_385391 [Didymella exigua CBS 183.55]KAF1930129.1 hypothetical protein M421DRAFT_385391 [Didymella exigua CBS 183.55]